MWQNIKSWTKKNKELIEFLIMFLTFCMVVATFCQVYQSAQQVKESKRAIDLQYSPQLDIEIESNRLPTVITENNYTKSDCFNVYKSDLIKNQNPSGEIQNTSQVAFFVNITFYNLGNVGTRLERIRYDFSCDPSGERDWQVDILRNRVIAPQKDLSYANSLFLDFGKVPEEDKKCSILFKFFFYNGFKKEIKYSVWYHDYDSSLVTKLEREMIQK